MDEQKLCVRNKGVKNYMKPKFTKEEIEQAGKDLVSNQSMIKTTLGALLGFLCGGAIYFIFALIGATFILFLFIPPFFVGLLAGAMGRPYEFKYKLIVFIVGMVTYLVQLGHCL